MTQVLTPSPDGGGGGVTTATAGLRAGLKGPWGERQGLTLVHYSAQRKHIMWDTLGA